MLDACLFFRRKLGLAVTALATLVLSLSVISPSALSAEIRIFAQTSQGVGIRIDGQIQNGDASKIQSAINLIETRWDDEKDITPNIITIVELNSNGGNLQEALYISELVKNKSGGTYVKNGSICASACFFIFASHKMRFAGVDSKIGVHGVSEGDGGDTERSRAATTMMARAARELGIPTKIIGHIAATPPTEVYWLTADDLRQMDVTLVAKN